MKPLALFLISLTLLLGCSSPTEAESKPAQGAVTKVLNATRIGTNTEVKTLDVEGTRCILVANRGSNAISCDWGPR